MFGATFEPSGSAAGREVLTANRTYYVATTGNDSNSGLTAGSPFLTIQKAINVVAALDVSIYDITIQIADGTYSANNITTLKNPVGSGQVTLLGNVTTPDNVILQTQIIKDTPGTIYVLKGFKFLNTTTGYFIFCSNGATIKFGIVNFGAGAGTAHIICINGGFVYINNYYTISAGTNYHFLVYNNGHVTMDYGTMNVSVVNTPAFYQFVSCADCSVIFFWPVLTFSGAATGTRYYAFMNGAIDTNGGGANYFPGSVAGILAPSGGQYA